MAYGSITGTYVAVGTPFAYQARIICFTNTTGEDVFFSTDTSTDCLIVPAGSFKLFDVTMNHRPVNMDDFCFAIGTQWYVRYARCHHQERCTLKSFTRSQCNGQNLRVDALVKQQNNEHLHLIANYQKEMQALRDSLNLSIQKFESLSQQKQQDLEEFKNLTEFHVANLKSRMVDAAEAVADNRKSIDDLHQLMLNFHDVYSRKIDTDKVKEELNSLVKECTNSHLNAFQDFQRETKNLKSSLTDELTMLKLKWMRNTQN